MSKLTTIIKDQAKLLALNAAKIEKLDKTIEILLNYLKIQITAFIKAVSFL